MTLREWFRESTTPKLALAWMITASAMLFTWALWWRFFTVYAIAMVVMMGAGFIIALLLAVEAIGATRSPPGLIPGVVMLGAVGVVLCAAPQLMRTGGAVVGSVSFRINEARYDAIVASVRRAPPVDPRGERIVDVTAGGVDYVVDLRPPIRVAFVQPGGFLDNWEGIVHDPSGEVAVARGWKPNRGYTAGPLVNLFGGTLVACAPLRRSYYRCTFT